MSLFAVSPTQARPRPPGALIENQKLPCKDLVTETFAVSQDAEWAHRYVNHHPKVQSGDLGAPFRTGNNWSAWVRWGANQFAAGFITPPAAKEVLSSPFNLVVSRTPGLGDPSRSSKREGSVIMTKANNRNGLQAESSAVIYKSNYKSYEGQGPERKTIAQLVRAQDREDFEAGRVTTFSWIDEMNSFSYQNYWGKLVGGGASHVIDVKAQPVGQLHVLLSRNSAEPLHTEVVTPPIARAKGEKIAELCRLHFLDDIDLDPSTRTTRDQYGKKRLIGELFRQAYSWMLNDAGINRVFFQVNERMLDRVKEYGIPTELAKVFSFDEEYVLDDGKTVTVTEYRLEFDRRAMERTEEILTAQSLISVLGEFITSADKMKLYYPSPALEFHFTLNQIRALERLSVINFSSEGKGQIVNTLDQHLLKIAGVDRSGVWQVHDSLRNDFLKVLATLSTEEANKMISILKAQVQKP